MSQATSCPYAFRLWPHLLFQGQNTDCGESMQQPRASCGITTEAAMKGIILNACAELGRPVVLLEEKPKECKAYNPGGCGGPCAGRFFRLESHGACGQGQSIYADACMADCLLKNAVAIKRATAEELDMPREIEGAATVQWFKIPLDDKEVIGLRCLRPAPGCGELAFLLEAEEEIDDEEKEIVASGVMMVRSGASADDNTFVVRAARTVQQVREQINVQVAVRKKAMYHQIIEEATNAFREKLTGVNKTMLTPQKAKELLLRPQSADELLLTPQHANELYTLTCDAFRDALVSPPGKRLSLEDYLGLRIQKDKIAFSPDQFKTIDQSVSIEGIDGFSEKDETWCYLHSARLFGNAMTQMTISDIGVSDEENFRKRQKQISKLLDEIYDAFAQKAEWLKANYHWLNTLLFTRGMRHELGQVYSGLTLALKDIMELLDLTGLDDNNKGLIDELLKEYQQYLHDSVLRVYTTKYMDGIPEPDREYFQPYDRFLYKWKFVYQRKSEKLHVIFDSNIMNGGAETEPIMYADPEMMEQVAYNLTNNAFKYSCPGTTVVFHCRRRGDKYEFYTSNYGTTIPDEQLKAVGKIYGFQGDNCTQDGSGIGLWHCREIALKHNGELDNSQSEKISEYNIMCLLQYLAMDEDERKVLAQKLNMDANALHDELFGEIARLKRDEAEHWAAFNENLPRLNSNDANYSLTYIAEKLRIGTTKYVFIIWIPAERSLQP